MVGTERDITAEQRIGTAPFLIPLGGDVPASKS